MRVFTMDELRRGKVPLLHSFDSVIRMIQGEMETASCILGAQIVGSCAYGHYSLTSDIDAVAIYRFDRRDEAMRLIRNLNGAAYSLRVPLQLISLDDILAQTRHHHIRADFAEHFLLCLMDGLSIKARLCDLVNFDPNEAVIDTKNYMVVKLKYFEEGDENISILSDEMRARLLGKALSFPVHAVRKMLQCLGCTFPNGDSRMEVVRLYQDSDLPGRDMFDRIVAMADGYRQMVRVQQERFDEETYQQELRRLEAAVPLAYDFARTCLFHMVERFAL